MVAIELAEKRAIATANRPLQKWQFWTGILRPTNCSALRTKNLMNKTGNFQVRIAHPTGSFPYKILGETPSEKLQNLHQLIDNWQTDLEIFRAVILYKFFSFKTVETENPSHPENEFNWQLTDNNN